MTEFDGSAEMPSRIVVGVAFGSRLRRLRCPSAPWSPILPVLAVETGADKAADVVARLDVPGGLHRRQVRLLPLMTVGQRDGTKRAKTGRPTAPQAKRAPPGLLAALPPRAGDRHG